MKWCTITIFSVVSRSFYGNNESFAKTIEPESSSIVRHDAEKPSTSMVSSLSNSHRSTANIDHTIDVFPVPTKQTPPVSDTESNNVINHVETQLQILQILETNVATSIEKMQSDVLLQVQDQQSLHEATKLFRELHIVQVPPSIPS